MIVQNSVAMSYLTDALQWNALVQWDQCSEGMFLCCVKTTGVYCRPTYASAYLQRENVTLTNGTKTATGQ